MQCPTSEHVDTEDVDLSNVAEISHLASVSLGMVGHSGFRDSHTWEVNGSEGQCTYTWSVRHALPHSDRSELSMGRSGT